MLRRTGAAQDGVTQRRRNRTMQGSGPRSGPEPFSCAVGVGRRGSTLGADTKVAAFARDRSAWSHKTEDRPARGSGRSLEADACPSSVSGKTCDWFGGRVVTRSHSRDNPLDEGAPGRVARQPSRFGSTKRDAPEVPAFVGPSGAFVRCRVRRPRDAAPAAGGRSRPCPSSRPPASRPRRRPAADPAV